MSKNDSKSLNERISEVEERLERRRAYLTEDTQEAATAASDTVARVAPIAAVVGAGLAGMWLGNRLTGRRRTRHATTASPAAMPRRGLRWASLAGIIGTAIRLGTSPEGRLVWDAVRRRGKAGG